MWKISRCRIYHSRISTVIFLMIVLLLSVGDLSSTESAKRESTVIDLNDAVNKQARREQLEQIVLRKLDYYAKQFPEINFLILDSAGDVARNMQVLERVVGQDPIPLDYEHPEELREALLIATLNRIAVLLPIDAGSATLFKPGKDAVAQRKYVCVVTIHPWAMAKDERVATRHLLGLSDSDFEAIPSTQYLDYVSHLQFALDHEIYHCLDTLYNGPIRLSKREFWAGYHMLKNEAGADAFGSIMNIARHGSITPYVGTLKNIRGLALLNDDHIHYTYSVIDNVLQMDATTLAKKDVRERFRLASTVRDRAIGSYDDYIRYRTAAHYATRQLGREVEAKDVLQGSQDPDLVRTLVKATQRAYYNLTGRKLSSVK